MSGNTRSVLIVDNDRDVADLVRAILQDEGYQVAVLADLSAAAVASAVGRLEPDAILLDGESEGEGYGSSWERAASLAGRDRPVPVIMFSAHSKDVREGREGLSDRAQRAKLAGVVGKPFDLEDLISVVAKAVGGSVPFDRSLAADAARSLSLANELESVGARDVHPSPRREWVTFRTPAGKLAQIYWWETGGSYLVGRYDADGRRIANIATTYDRRSAVEICGSVIRAEEDDARKA